MFFCVCVFFFFPPLFFTEGGIVHLCGCVCARQTRGGGRGGGEGKKEKLRLSAELYLPSPVGQLIWFVKYVNNQMINK